MALLCALLRYTRGYPLLLRTAPLLASSRHRHFSKRHVLAAQRDSHSMVLAEQAFAVLARKSKSWRRLRHLVDLAVSSNTSDDDSQAIRSVIDVGTDHGLLAVGLAVSGCFDRVLGIDVSERALQNGALRLKDQIQHYRSNNDMTCQVPVEFRLGDGLRVAHPGEADAVCIAGMGPHSIVKIVSSKVNKDNNQLLLDWLGCQQLIVQPTNSRPGNLILLYDRLHDIGWQVQDERIEYMSSRWYISTLFERSDRLSSERCLPGQKLVHTTSADPSTWKVFRDYVCHHRLWIRQDKAKGGDLREEDDRWLRSLD